MNLLRKFVNRQTLKKYWWLGFLLLTLISSTTTFILIQGSNKPKEQKTETKKESTPSAQRNNQYPQADPNSTDPVAKGKYLSGGKCQGEGSKKLGSAPMNPADISYIIPYGLLAGGHVTPIDHQYYWGKVPFGEPDMYDILALDEGRLVELTYRDRSHEGKKIKGDYRGVIAYSCTFFSYFDLATSMAPEIAEQLPEGWNKSGHGKADINIPVKKGQVIAKFGGQSLDFAIWDTKKQLKNLLVPIAYNNAEPWKIVTVNPLDYFSEEVKKQILPFYLRKTEPLDGIIDQDIDGRVAGNWFLEGTNGYAGVFSYGSAGGGQNNYWAGHLALVPSHLDPSGWFFSSGDVNGEAKQFGLKNPAITPDKLEISSGIVKYEIAQPSHVDDSGQIWIGKNSPNGNLKFQTSQSMGTVLVQLLEKRKLKVEVFLNKTPSQVSGFTAKAKVYDRGDNAKMIVSNTRT